MKAVMISIQPKQCEQIANGKKTIEVRKTKPKIDMPFKCYIYCTNKFHRNGLYPEKSCWINTNLCNAKVIGEFICDSILGIPSRVSVYDGSEGYAIFEGDLAKTCVRIGDLFDYGRGKTLYGWHISDLIIYDKPKELGEFQALCQRGCNDINNDWCYCERTGRIYECKYNDREKGCCAALTRPPQSWCYVEEIEC